MKKSAGILLYRAGADGPEVFLVHPGGPFWKNKDAGAWSIPKGEFAAGEDALTVARREYEEETGNVISGPFRPLTPVKQKGGKVIHAWAAEGNIDPSTIKSNTFSLEWPPRSGKMIEVPEIDKGEWFALDEAKLKLNPGQVPLVDQLTHLLSS